MQVSYKWLSEYLDLSKVTPQQLADTLTLGGLEVELVHEQGKDLTHLVVGEVLSLEAVEGSDKLKVAQVNVGQSIPLQIVCGAPNIEEGQKVIVAQVGAVLPGNFEIKAAQLMGHDSQGMICSLQELGFNESVIPKHSEEGIYILSADAEVGADVRPYLGLDDAVIEFDITPNRADALSVRGIAYDASAMLNEPLHFPETVVEENSNKKIEDFIKVGVESKEDTLDYRMRVVEDVKITTSPLWMQRKLMSAGIRPIDLPVDITNYVMLEFGQPLHAFDYDKLPEKEIYVRRAKDKEEIITLDGKTHQLNDQQLVITSGDEPVAVAGVMGGQNTEISSETKTVAIEAAAFHPALTRRSAAAMSMRSESSGRFEKGINMGTVQEALDLAASLMAELGGGKVVKGTAQIEVPEPEDIVIPITQTQIARILGVELELEEVVEIFDRLHFAHELDGDKLLVSIPPRRWDILIAEDLAEEIARVYGYNNIPRTLPMMKTVPGKLTEEQLLVQRLDAYLRSVGLTEAINYTLHTSEDAIKFQKESIGEPVELMNPMSQEHATMQQNMIVGLLNNAQYNRARHPRTVSQYEVGHVFYKKGGEYYEPRHVSGIIAVGEAEESWQGIRTEPDFYTIKGIVEGALALRSTDAKVSYVATSEIAEMHPGRTALVYLDDRCIGFFGQVHPQVASDYDLKETYVFELSIEEWMKTPVQPLVYQEISRFPSGTQDIALLVSEEVTHEEIVETISEAAKGSHLASIHLFDLYEGQNIESSKKSLAYSLRFTNPEATLTDEEVKKAMEKITQALEQKLQAEIR